MSPPLCDSCCGCISLRTGTLLYGYLHMILYLFGIVSALLLIGMGAINEADHVYLIIGGVLLVVSVVQLIFIIFLLIGGHKGKPGFIKAYLVYATIMMIMTFKAIIFSVMKSPSVMIIIHIFIYVLEIYFILVIRSYKKTLEDDVKDEKAAEICQS